MKRKPENYRRVPRGAIKIDLPNTTQTEGYTCGPSALLAVFAYFGVGPEDEWDFEQEMGIPRSGSDPRHLVEMAEKYRLELREYQPMRTDELVACLDRARPVIVMLQAWAERKPRSYRDRWDDGHWVVAIGHDRDGVYFEDPSIHAARGFLTYAELDERWHDVEGRRKRHVERYGVAIWKRGARAMHLREARRIG